MEKSKRCLILYPDGRQEFIYKSTISVNYHRNELEKYVDKINRPPGSLGGNCKSSLGASLNPYILTYYGSNYLENAINVIDIRDPLDLCNCDMEEPHNYHGIVGIAKYIEGTQVDYQQDDLENALNFKPDSCVLH
jgi:hypothetical protein